MRIDRNDFRLEVIKNYVEGKIGVNDISLPTKTNLYVFSRATFYYLALEYTGYTKEDIGTYVGRDHACVIHAMNRTLPKAPEIYNEAIREFNPNSLLSEEVGYTIVKDNENLVLTNRDLEERNEKLRMKLSTILNDGVVGRLAGFLETTDFPTRNNMADRIDAMISMEKKKIVYKSQTRKPIIT